MDDRRAIEIVKRLADGIDPFTGEVFPPDSPYQNADTVRSLHKAIEVMESAAKKLRRAKELPERAGKTWDKTESDLLVQRFDEGLSIADLAEGHKRTRGAIKSQLLKLGKFELLQNADRPDGL